MTNCKHGLETDTCPICLGMKYTIKDCKGKQGGDWGNVSLARFTRRVVLKSSFRPSSRPFGSELGYIMLSEKVWRKF